jgi:dipeptidyl aminopeptidase/acylaminoacyl peptidase
MRNPMRLVSLILVFIVCGFGSAWCESEGWTPELALEVKRVGSVQVSSDGQWAAFVVSEAVMDGEKSEWISHIHLARSDGSRSFQLTQGAESAVSPAWSPDGNWIAFVSSRESGKSNIWRIRLGGGEAERVTDEKGGVAAFVWSPDGSRIAFQMPEPEGAEEEKKQKEKRDARVVDEDLDLVDLYVVPVEKNAEGERPVRKLTAGEFSVGGSFGAGGPSWSPDGKSIVFSHQPTPKVNDWTQTDISLIDVGSGAVRTLVATEAAEASPVFSPDGKWIAYTASDAPPTWGFTSRVHVVPAVGGPSRALAESYDRQPSIVGWSADGSKVFITETHRTVDRLSALPVDGGKPVDVSSVDPMVVGPALNRAGTHFGFSSQTAESPPEAFVSRVAPFELTQVSHVQNLPDVPIGKTETLQWKSTDGTQIEGLLPYPVGYETGPRVPLLVIVHGGPTGVFVQSFIASRGAYPIAAFASSGYAVLRCNVRGSSGYGRDFRYANYEDWGGGDYVDIMSGVDHIVQMGVADPDRLGVMGWSYGGYMTSWIITRTDRFKAASVGAGVTNLMSFTGTADIPGFIPDYFGGEYWDVFDRWRSHSAMFNVKGVSTPTLIQHGERDERVPISRGYELYNALLRQGVTVKMVVYPRQPHGIREPKLQLDAMKRNLDWFERWIPVGAKPASNE